MDSLAKKHNRRDIRKALESLPKELDDTYNEAMRRISNQDEEDAKLAERVLSWISYAFRPLTIIEVQHALAVEPGNADFDGDALPDEDVLVSVCAGLVTIDQESIIRLVHYTTQEYFERTQMSWFPHAQTDIAMTCITYLSFDVFAVGFCPTDEEFEARLQLNALYDYAARNWGYHARAASTEVEPLILYLFKSEAKVSACSQAMMAFKSYLSYRGYSQRVPRQTTGVHLAAYFGLKEAVKLLLADSVDPDSKNTEGQTPLLWAAENGHEAVVRQLLEHKADINAKTNNNRWTALYVAAESGHEAVVRLLLEHKADVEAKNNYGETALHRAARNGHEAVVQLLLDHKADVEAKNNYRWTALYNAAWNGQEAVVQLLLDHKADVKAKAYNGMTALHRAAWRGHETVVQLLLDHKVDIEAKDNNGETALHCAARNGHMVVVQQLLDHYKENDVLNFKEDTEVVTKLLTNPKSRVRCDGCKLWIPNWDPHYHCGICNAGDFDLCQDCVGNDDFCSPKSHRLIKRRVRENGFIEITSRRTSVNRPTYHLDV
jgi:ankyrin repeat protein